MGSLQKKMWRKTPERLFPFEPAAVDDLIEKFASALHALAEHKVAESYAAVEVVALEMRAVPVALVLKKSCSRKGLPLRASNFFGARHGWFSYFGIRMPIRGSDQRP